MSLKGSNKGAKSGDEDIFLAGRSLHWYSIGFSIFNTNINPIQLMGMCAAAYASGMVTANFEWLAWWFLMLLAMLFVPFYLTSKTSTLPEFMEKRFGKNCHTFLSYYALLTTLVLWLGGSLYAGGKMVAQLMDWELWQAILFIAAIATSFTAAGGLAAVVRTEVFQSILILGASATMTVMAFNKIGSLDRIIEQVPNDYWTLFRPSDDKAYPWHAVLLGYPVLAIWYWCADQTIVQRVLAARDIKNAQGGAIFTSLLKVIMPIIFLVPGILCLVLYPNLTDPDQAYFTLVTGTLPHGMIGLIVAVLIAALIGGISSGLNSFSTVFTLDVYAKAISPNATSIQLNRVGRWVTLFAALLAVGFGYLLSFAGKNLFDLLQSIIAFFAPPMSAVFLIGVLWKRATGQAAFATLLVGSIICISIGLCSILGYPNKEFWPHFLLLSFYLFAGLSAFFIILSLSTQDRGENKLPTLGETLALAKTSSSPFVWYGWGLVAVIMFALYALFN